MEGVIAVFISLSFVQLCRSVIRVHQEREMSLARSEKEELLRLRRVASTLAKEVKHFWESIQKVCVCVHVCRHACACVCVCVCACACVCVCQASSLFPSLPSVQIVEHKQHVLLEEKRKKAMDMHLEFIVDQTQKYSSWLVKGLTGNKTPSEPSLQSVASASGTSCACSCDLCATVDVYV